MPFVAVATDDEIPPGKMKHVELSGKEIMLANVAGQYYAVNDRCGHMNGRLSMGTLEGKIVTCPIHYSRFDVTNGKVVAGPRLSSIGNLKNLRIPEEMLKSASRLNDLQTVIKTYDLPTYQVQVRRNVVLVEA